MATRDRTERILSPAPDRPTRDACYYDAYKAQYERKNDTMMSYFTRVYDGYWYKFCILIHLAADPQGLANAIKNRRTQEFLRDPPVSQETAAQAFYLCDFYLQNTLPLLELLDEQDKLAGERKIISLLVNNFQGRAKHSDLMILAHMRKREFKEIIESLIEKEAITVETYVSSQGNTGRMYVLAADLFNSWHS